MRSWPIKKQTNKNEEYLHIEYMCVLLFIYVVTYIKEKSIPILKGKVGPAKTVIMTKQNTIGNYKYNGSIEV